MENTGIESGVDYPRGHTFLLCWTRRRREGISTRNWVAIPFFLCLRAEAWGRPWRINLSIWIFRPSALWTNAATATADLCAEYLIFVSLFSCTYGFY
ncbi:hypothetical protein BDZ89DRAFT_149129 [Hymenopellis radicata]|nr:hypothetical protein BDZ89DRAFT_149129 [Hymenopellis radicata]